MRIAALIIWLAGPVAAQSPEAAAGAAMTRLQAAQEQLASANGRSNRVRALTETVQAYEDGLAAMRAGLRQVAAREASIDADIAAQRTELSGLIAALQSIGRTPLPVIQHHPDGALAAARAGGVLADLTPAVEAEIDTLRGQLQELQSLRDLRLAAQTSLADGLDQAQSARSALGIAISERTDLPKRFEQDPVQMALLEASTQTLAGFAAGLAGTLPSTDVQLTPVGNLPLPVDGDVLPDDGQGRPGVRIAAPAQGLVTTPVAATLLYRGPLLDLGHVVILEPTIDVLFVIAGMAETFGEPGEILPSGAAIGLMGGKLMADDSNLSQNSDFAGNQDQQTLYLEVRGGQSLINPDTWFALE